MANDTATPATAGTASTASTTETVNGTTTDAKTKTASVSNNHDEGASVPNNHALSSSPKLSPEELKAKLAELGVGDKIKVIENDAIRKPDIDTRTYRLLRLPNELEILLVHDADTEKAAAAMDVNVGHLCDPDDWQGLAHFLEHLLFMGTEKYPLENDYSEYLSKHSGYSNAYTGSENTNYYFEVSSEFLEPALDRFAQFFLSPLFNESGVDREMQAVDSEHKKNLQNDGWRLHQLDGSLSDPKHPWSKFGTGCLETLKQEGKDIRSVLMEFHKKYYSANLMKVAILGKGGLERCLVRVHSERVVIRSRLFLPQNLSTNSRPWHFLSFFRSKTSTCPSLPSLQTH